MKAYKVGIIAMMLALILSGCGNAGKAKEVILSFEGAEVLADELNFYLKMNQAQWEAGYEEVLGDGMWESPLGEEIGTLADGLKEEVMTSVKEIHLLESKAKEYEIELTDEEIAAVGERVTTFFESQDASLLEEAGATEELVGELLTRDEVAKKVKEAIKNEVKIDIKEEDVAVGLLKYALFSTLGTRDAEGNQTAYTKEELEEQKEMAGNFQALATELGSIEAAGESFPHTLVDVYYGKNTDGGSDPAVAEAARNLEEGQVSEVLKTADGYYVVENVKNYDEEGTKQYREQAEASYLEQYYLEKVQTWMNETEFVLNEEFWNGIEITKMF